MFETVAPEVLGKRSRRLFYETLPLSIGAHVVVIAAFMTATVWKVTFPNQSPKLFATYSLAEPPPPPPPPPPAQAAAPKRVATTQPVVQQQLQAIVAPTIIPDEIPFVSNIPFVPVSHIDEGVEGGIEGGVAGGVVGGTTSGVEGGDVGGVDGGTIGGVVTDTRIHIARDKKLPLFPVSQVYPAYPEEARLRSWEDRCVVRYVIGKDGRVKEVSIVNRAEREIFEKEAMKAIKNWRFRPMIKEGEAQEVVHELTVFFKLEG